MNSFTKPYVWVIFGFSAPKYDAFSPSKAKWAKNGVVLGSLGTRLSGKSTGHDWSQHLRSYPVDTRTSSRRPWTSILDEVDVHFGRPWTSIGRLFATRFVRPKWTKMDAVWTSKSDVHQTSRGRPYWIFLDQIILHLGLIILWNDLIIFFSILK